MIDLDDLETKLLTPEDVAALRAGRPISKGPTRLEQTMDARPLTKVDEKAFRDAVWDRDKYRCRCCGRKVQRIFGRVPQRGEVHHVHGRGGDLRFEPITALLLCLRDHERVTGRVNDKLVIVPTQTVIIRGETFTDARFPVLFKAVL